MTWDCPLCGHKHVDPLAARNRFCEKCCVFVDEVLNASPSIRAQMARFTRGLANQTRTKAALAQARTWERAMGR